MDLFAFEGMTYYSRIQEYFSEIDIFIELQGGLCPISRHRGKNISLWSSVTGISRQENRWIGMACGILYLIPGCAAGRIFPHRAARSFGFCQKKNWKRAGAAMVLFWQTPRRSCTVFLSCSPGRKRTSRESGAVFL